MSRKLKKLSLKGKSNLFQTHIFVRYAHTHTHTIQRVCLEFYCEKKPPCFRPEPENALRCLRMHFASIFNAK